MKRKSVVDEKNDITKKNKIVEPSFVSGTDVRNYMLNDPLVDWLKLYKNDARSNNAFSSFVMNKGVEFEKEVVRQIETIAPTVSISQQQAIKDGIPIIHSVPFKNLTTRTHGVIDLLVRNDYLHLFTDYKYVHDCKEPYHYIAIDIKFSTLGLRTDGIHLLNSGNYPAYKAQLWIYTQALQELQGYVPHVAFILGRRWTYTNKGETFFGMNCFEKLGVIDYTGVDVEYGMKTTKAIDWVRSVREQGVGWTLYPPSVPELYPNMCIDSGEWNIFKKELATQLGDITQIWYCGSAHRDTAFGKGIYSWRDKKCTSKTLGMNGARADTVDKMLLINRQTRDKLRPNKVENNLFDWKNKGVELFVDFETFCDVFAPLNLPEQPKTDRIFMIGVWVEGKYKNFVATDCSPEAEYVLMNNFVDFVKTYNNPKLWYWHAESFLWTKSENNQLDRMVENGDTIRSDIIVDVWKNLKWCDLCRIFREEPIVIKGCFKFGLKEVANAMREHGFIKSEIKSKCHTGLDASVLAWEAYQKPNVLSSEILLDIAKYNEYDVRVLHEMIEWLRENRV